MPTRSYLFVPGDRPDRFLKASNAGADAVILDLEDAVAPAAKSAAREAVSAWLSTGARAYVRMNAAATPWFDDDLRALRQHDNLLGIVVPKAEDEGSLREIAHGLPQAATVLPLIETAAGFDSLREIARSPKVQCLLFGTLDFQVDMGIRGDGDELLYFRSQLTLVSRLANIGAPVDGVTTSIDDGKLIEFETRRARNLGFRGKLCIHPRLVEHVHAAFAHSEEDIAWAKRVLHAVKTSGGAATTVDGKMVDLPVILKARDILGA
jgi:citrate lyase subunit beta/citryl-CoA lyase